MTKQEYDRIHDDFFNSTAYNSSIVHFRWQVLKVLWEIRDAIKGGLAE